NNPSDSVEKLPISFQGYNCTPMDYVICGGGAGLKKSGPDDGACSMPLGLGQNPVRKWMAQANGVRMIFGYDNKYIDSLNYVRYFGEEWAKSQSRSLATAFLEASWRVNTQQSPTAVACGGTLIEATTRLTTERDFQSGSVACNWMAWRWYATKSLSISR